MADGLPLIKGTLDLLVLKALSCNAQHGYGVSKWLEQWSGGDLVVVDSALYQALHRLDDRGWVEAEWGVTDKNRRARFYHLTRAGHRELMKQGQAFTRYAELVGALLSVDAPAAGRG